MRSATTIDEQPSLQHIMIVGGSLYEWGVVDADAWHDRIASLGASASAEGARWLTLRPFERGEHADEARPVHPAVVGVDNTTVIVDPTSDGRERLVVTLRKLIESDQLSESAVAAALLAPATAEPDLVLLLGTSDRLPTSLVWELAYSELVYIPITWRELSAQHLVPAIEAYRGRHRRFGGLD